MPPYRSDDPERQLSRPLHRLGAGFQLALAHGEQASDRWALATDRPNTIGRAAPSSVPPDVDLWPDRRALEDGPDFLSSTFSGRH